MAGVASGEQPGAQGRDLDLLLSRIRQGDRGALARAITLVESTLEADQADARHLVEAAMALTPESLRIGITGIPGVGKSTFIEQLGLYLLSKGLKVAVLAVDPSSRISKGSILGDKTRMQELSRAEGAFVRPSPAGESLGGVARKTRECISLCEAAGYPVVLIETVGVGQSETEVHGMTDFFLLLKIAGAGDELQGIKRGILEMADAIVINKADGANLPAAREAQAVFRQALHLFPPKPGGWQPEVLLCSSMEGSGFAAVWELIERYRAEAGAIGAIERKRRQQNIAWLRRTIAEQLSDGFYQHPAVRESYPELERAVAERQMSPFTAARRLLDAYTGMS